MSSRDAIADLDLARDELFTSFHDVPDGALGWLKPGDDYALGGLITHLHSSLNGYLATLERIVAQGYVDTEGPAEEPAEVERRLEKARAGLSPDERVSTFEDLARSHARLSGMLKAVPEDRFDVLVGVRYPDDDVPYPTSPRLIGEWMTNHYREHVPQVRDLLAAWNESR
jgi:hypothetical protein